MALPTSPGPVRKRKPARRRWRSVLRRKLAYPPALFSPSYGNRTQNPQIWTEPARALTWTAPTMTVFTKRAGEVRSYALSFANLPEITGGQQLTGITSVTANIVTNLAGAGNLTVGASTLSGSSVQVLLSGGTDGVTYQIVFTVTTNAGVTLVGIGYLLVEDF
jgi:hypothetical protein